MHPRLLVGPAGSSDVRRFAKSGTVPNELSHELPAILPVRTT